MLPTDPALPWLNALLDADAMRDRFAALVLRDVDRPGLRIRSLSLDRFRYRKSERAVVLYKATLEDEQHSRGEEHWVSLSIFSGTKSRKTYKRAFGESGGHTIRICGHTLPCVSYIDEFEGLVQWFPQDRHLPSLAQVARGQDLEVNQAITVLPGHPGDAIAFKPVRYRPGIGATLLASSCLPTPPSDCAPALAFVKLYTDLDAASAVASLRALGDAARATAGAFDVVEPIGCAPSSGALLLRPAPGMSAEHHVKGVSALDDIARRCARALAAFHLSEIQLPRRTAMQDTVMQARRAADLLALIGAEVDELVNGIVRQIAAESHRAPLCPAHLDMKADHMFIDGDRLCLIDMESCAMGNPLLDPAMLVAQLQAMPDITDIDRDRVTVFCDTFISAYFNAVPAAWQRGYAIACKLAALKVALYYLQHLVPDWQGKVTSVLRQAVRA